MIEALRFTSGVSNCSNNRVTFKKIHNARFTVTRVRHSLAERIESGFACSGATCVVTAWWTRGARQNSLRMTAEVGSGPLGKQCMSGVDPIAIMRQHALHIAKSSHFCREMPQ
jgi:hypothetical protein